jgi:hypothetical protein
MTRGRRLHAGRIYETILPVFKSARTLVFLIPSVERHAPLFERPGTPEKSMSNRYSQ